MEQNLLQTKASILQKVKIIENIAQLVAFDTKMQTFLENGFENEANQYEDYQYNILPSIENILRQNKTIYSIRVYVFNPTIPELSDCFYNISRIQNEALYREWLTKSSKQQYGWGTIHQARVNIPRSDQGPPEQVFSYYRQIYSIRSNNLVGLVEIETKESVLFDHQPAFGPDSDLGQGNETGPGR